MDVSVAGSDRDFTVALLQRRCLLVMINWKYKTNFIRKISKENATVEFKEITKAEQHKSIIEKEYIIIYVKGENQ